MNVEEINIQTLREYIEETMNRGEASERLFQGVEWNIERFDEPFYSESSNTVREYTRLMIESEWIGCMHLCPEKFLPESILSEIPKERHRPMNRDKHKTVTRRVFKDSGHANMLFCMSCWLSIDGKPWRGKFSATRKKLSTSLVLKYPEFVIPFCSYFIGLKRQPYRELLLVDSVRDYIDEFTDNHLSKLGLG